MKPRLMIQLTYEFESESDLLAEIERIRSRNFGGQRSISDAEYATDVAERMRTEIGIRALRGATDSIARFADTVSARIVRSD